MTCNCLKDIGPNNIKWIVYAISVRKQAFSKASRFNLRMCEFFRLWYRFLIELSDLPGNSLRISDHLLPKRRWLSNRILSSSAVQHVFFNLLSKTLTYRSRKCSPVLPCSSFAIWTHLNPWETIEMINSSSCLCQLPRTTPGFKYCLVRSVKKKIC